MLQLITIPIDVIRPNEWNPNVMTEEEYEKLKTSIELTNGEYLEDNPIMVRPVDDGFYEIIDGEHRWTVAVDLGYTNLYCNVRDVEDQTAMELCVILNKDRGQINYFKLSKLLTNAYEAYSHDLNQEELGRKFGYSQQTIQKILPIYERLKNYVLVRNFTNKDLIQLARVRNNDLRHFLVKTLETKIYPSSTLQNLATTLNKIDDYLNENILDTQLRSIVLTKLIEIGDIVFDYGESALIDEINLLYKKEQQKRIIHGDMFEEIDDLNIEFDCVFTDPPYGVSYDNLIEMEGRKNIDRNKGEWDQYTPEQFKEFTEKWIEKTVKVLKKGGTFLIFTCDHYLSYVIGALEKNGLKKRNTIVWHKKNPPPSATKTNFLSSSEFIVYATKGKQKTFNWFGDKEMHDVIECPLVSGKKNLGHPTQKPVKLLEKILKSITNVGDLVLDPFAGTGSTAVACEKLGRGWVMIEKDEKYYGVMKRRLLK